MLLICDVCGQSEAEGRCARCDHVRERFQKLRDELRETENKLHRIQEAGLKVLSDSRQELLDEQESITVKVSLLKNLWDALELKWYNQATLREFLSERLVEGMVLCEAMDLFQSRHQESVESKLQQLLNSCKKVNEFHGWPDTLDLTPEDIVKPNLFRMIRRWFMPTSADS